MKIKVTQEVDVSISPYCKNCFRQEKDKTDQYYCSLYNRYLTEARSNFLKCRECYLAVYDALESEERENGLNLNLAVLTKGRIAEQIALWLSKEHKSNKYVPLQSVLDVLQNSLPATCLDYDTADKIFQEVYNLDGKELDE